MFISTHFWNYLAAAISLALTLQVTGEQDGERREAVRGTLQTHLTEKELLGQGKLLDLKFKPLSGAYPTCEFFVLRFGRYPVEIVPPEPLKASNVFAVCGERITLIRDEKQLEKFFTANPPNLADERALADATKSWLYLAGELQKDGFVEFERPEVSTAANSAIGTANVVPKRGDQGKLIVELKIVDGKLKIIRSSADVKQGIRPRCQATRLLDDDPVIREIMKRDILVMGSACQSYLEQVRADAGPELRQAIDEVWQQIVVEGR